MFISIMNKKIGFVALLLVLLFLIGCTTQVTDNPPKIIDQPANNVVEDMKPEEMQNTEPVPMGNKQDMANVDVSSTKEFDVQGFNFGYNIKEIKVKKGDVVKINFAVTDGFHDFVIDEFDVATQRIRDSDTDTVTFTADKAGEFEFYCSVGSHRSSGMVGKLIVEA